MNSYDNIIGELWSRIKHVESVNYGYVNYGVRFRTEIRQAHDLVFHHVREELDNG